MKILFTSIVSLICLTGFSQTNLSTENAKTIIGVFFDGMNTGDTLKMKSIMMPNMGMQTAYLSKEGENKITYSRGSDFIKMIGNLEKNTKIEERILDVRLETDGNIANVWTPYEFYMNDTFSHCGANSFTLIYTDESWKILNIIDSRRIGSCDQKKD